MLRFLVRSAFLKIAFILVIAPIVYQCMKLLFKTNTEIDFGDESLALIGSSLKDGHRTFLYGFEWFTRVLYFSSGENLSNYRSIGASLLFFVGMLTAFVIYDKFFNYNVSYSLTKSSLTSVMTKLIMGMTGGLVSLNYYQGFARSPNYNWLNYFGILVAIIAFLNLLNLSTMSKCKLFSYLVIFAISIILTFFAKPTTPFFLLICFIILRFRMGIRILLKEVLLILIFTVLIISLLIFFKVIPQNFLLVVYYKLNAPPMAPEHTIAYSFFDIFRMLLKIPIYANKIELVILAVGIGLLIFFKNKLIKFVKLAPKFVLLFTLILLVLVSSIYYRIRFAGLDIYKFQLKLFVLMLVIAIILFFINIPLLKKETKNLGFYFQDSKGILLVLLVCTYVYSFGGTDGYFHKFSEFTAFFFFIVLILVSKFQISLFSKVSLLILISFLTTVSNILVVSSNFEEQYFRNSQHVVQFGKNTNNEIFLKIEQKNQLNRLRLAVINEGFNSSTPLINLASPGYSYFLHGNVPDSIHPTFFNRDNSIKLFEYNIYHQNRKFDYRSSWIIFFNEISPFNYSGEQTKKAKEVIEKVTNLDIKSGYKVVYYDHSISVLKPIDAAQEKIGTTNS
jgi:hypothetical protein